MASDLTEQFGSSIAVLGMHFDAEHSIPWNIRRKAFYTDFAGYPTWMIDGVLDSRTGSPYFWDSWGPDTAARSAKPAVVTIDLSAAPGPTPDVWDITATVCVEPDGTGKSMRIYLAEVLDKFPVGAHFTRNGIRQVAETEDIVLASGACQDVIRTFILDATSMATFDDVSIIGWAQKDADNGPAEVYQAAQMMAPFLAEGVFADDFESGDTDGWTTAVQ